MNGIDIWSVDTITSEVQQIANKLDDHIAKAANQVPELARQLVNRLRRFEKTSDQLEKTHQHCECSLEQVTGFKSKVGRYIALGNNGSPAGDVPCAWDEILSDEHTRMLSTQFHLLKTLVRVLRVATVEEQETELSSPSLKRLLDQSNTDATAIRETSRSANINIASNMGQGSVIDGLIPLSTESYHQTCPVTTNRSAVAGRNSMASGLAAQSASFMLTERVLQKPTLLRRAFISRKKPINTRNALITDLCRASQDNDKGWAEDILSQGVDVDGVDGRSLAPLHYATKAGHLEMVRLLVENGAQINGVARRSSAIMATAIDNNQIRVLRYLLDNGADADALYFDRIEQKCPLQLAIQRHRPEAVSLLMSHNANVNYTGPGSLSILATAVETGQKEMVTLILAKAAVNAAESQTRWGSRLTALHVAAYKGHDDILNQLLLAGACPTSTCNLRKDGKDNVGDLTALHLARGRCAASLIRAGVGVYSKDSKRQLPLSRAAQWGNLEAFGDILAAGGPVNAADNEGNTALHHACRTFASEANEVRTTVLDSLIGIVKGLIRRGASVESQRAGFGILREGCRKVYRLQVKKKESLPGHMEGLAKLVVKRSEKPQGHRSRWKGRRVLGGNRAGHAHATVDVYAKVRVAGERSGANARREVF
ncbi:hypothetical protein MKZ38_001999 [Zalerion maritima]|uniref:Ankyrin repeat protein n=1 Tax=Zalerion maritima TaxID=339359 RepID=A0AAD5RPG3_9PEZI|nr:hypothetical protein MKZ38_001999 [Zalerion maritima]